MFSVFNAKVMYVQVNAICVIILIYLLVRSHIMHEKQTKDIAFNKALCANITILLLDILWVFLDGAEGPAFRYINYITNILYITNTGFISYFWYCFVDARVERRRIPRRSEQVLLFMPIVALFLLCATSHMTNLMFSIDENNIYHRGPLNFIQFIVSYFYIVLSLLRILRSYINESRKTQRSEYITMMAFFILPVIGGILSAIYPGVPSTWTTASLSLLMVYFNLQSYQISTDELTGLNNRRRFDNYIADAVTGIKKNEHLYLLLADINSFKNINDTYGHVEGDNVLIQVGDMLKEVSSNMNNIFTARFGGDEFAILCRSSSITEAIELKRSINRALDTINLNPSSDYSISLSIGISEYTYDCGMTISQFIAAADDELYKEKAIYKAALFRVI